MNRRFSIFFSLKSVNSESLSSPEPTIAKLSTEDLQRKHYNAVLSEYEKHYDDEWSQRYRKEFMYRPLFNGISLKGATVLEGMCGSGQATGFLRDCGASVVGLDISDVAVESFRSRWPGTNVRCASILQSGLPDDSFDTVVVIAGLHHVHPHVDEAVREVARVLKPGGYFCFIEPHAGSLPDWFRSRWYQRDRKYFAENEASIDVAALARRHADRFQVEQVKFTGGLSYLIILNSLILRIPHNLKRYYTPPLLAFERWTSRLHTRRLSCLAVCRWVKR